MPHATARRCGVQGQLKWAFTCGFAIFAVQTLSHAVHLHHDDEVAASRPKLRGLSVAASPIPSGGDQEPTSEQRAPPLPSAPPYGRHRRNRCDVLFGIPTLARGTTNYLNTTLEALLCQLPPRSWQGPKDVCIAVYEVRAPKGRTAPTPFDLARKALAERSDVFFVRSNLSSRDTDLSTPKTRRQTMDVARMLLALHPLAASHFVLMEDDWLLCEGGMAAIHYLLAKAHIYQPGWAALRFSYGLNGILLKGGDLPPLAQFLLNPAAVRDVDLPYAPVDHLTYRWLSGKYSAARSYFGSRRIMAFRHTLFWHIGDVSSVGNHAGRHKPKCYGLTKEWLFSKESFHTSDCPDDDLWPCDQRPDGGSPRSLELLRVVEEATAASPGAKRCGETRLCWGRPGGTSAAASAKCASRLRCTGPNGGSTSPCVPELPEYSTTSVLVPAPPRAPSS
jgi:hypothetical protein